MVFPKNNCRQEEKTDPHRAVIIEVVGPAGAGKTSLFRALEKSGPGIRAEFLPPVWNLRYTPFFIKNILLLAPTLVQIQGKGDRNPTRRELAWMAMLKGWPEILRKKAEVDHRVILLDQGPIFLMAILSEFGPGGLRYPNMQGYWGKITKQWTHALDIVIWLDAEDEILIKRIRTRQDEHLMKDKTDQEMKTFLVKYRTAYERLIDRITMNNCETRVLRMDTGKNSTDDLVRCVLSNLSHGIGNQ